MPIACELPNRRRPIVYASAADRQRLEWAGLTTVSAIRERLRDVPERHRGRKTGPIELRNAAGQPTCLYAKLQTGRPRWIPRLKDIRAGMPWGPAPIREWCGLHALRQAGLFAARPVACLSEGRIWPASVTLIEPVPAARSLHDSIAGGDWHATSEQERNAILAATADVVQQMHAAGLAWRSLTTKHLYPERCGDDWRIWLIDCEGVERRAGPRQFHRDRQKLLFWLAYSGAAASDVERLQSLLANRQPSQTPSKQTSLARKAG